MKPKILLIEWRDACGSSGWKSRDKTQTEPSLVRSVGIVIKKTKRAITLAQSESITNRNYDHTIVIPRGSIKSKRALKG